jgi:serine/threonine protein phosphatase PrpC
VHIFLNEEFNLFLSIQLSTGGGRLVICSDGVWDALAAEVALDCCRGMSAEASAPQIVKVR